MRVLQVLEASLGGTRRYLDDLSHALGDGDRYGLVYSLDRADVAFPALVERLRRKGWVLFEVDMCRRIDPRRDLASVLALAKIYRVFKPDVVHAHSSKAGAVARLATLGMRKRPGLVYSPHAISVNLGRLFHAIERVLALRLDVLAAVSASERDELRSLKLVPAERIHVVTPTIDPAAFAPSSREAARGALGLGAGPLVVSIGRLAEQKDPLAYVDFVAALREHVGDVRALWVGDGELRGAMHERIAARGLTDVLTITGWLDDVRPYLAACDLLVSTSAYESFGYVAAEALAMRRPVVASAVTGTVDVVATDTEQQLYRRGDVRAGALLAERLLVDRERAERVADRGRSHVVAAFSTAMMRSGLTTAYAEAAQCR
jgi:glycosyltransferase involved in cell wall biosynthesis